MEAYLAVLPMWIHSCQEKVEAPPPHPTPLPPSSSIRQLGVMFHTHPIRMSSVTVTQCFRIDCGSGMQAKASHIGFFSSGIEHDRNMFVAKDKGRGYLHFSDLISVLPIKKVAFFFFFNACFQFE